MPGSENVRARWEEEYVKFLESRVFVGEPTHETTFRAGFGRAVELAARTADAFGALAAGTAIRALSPNTKKEQP